MNENDHGRMKQLFCELAFIEHLFSIYQDEQVRDDFLKLPVQVQCTMLNAWGWCTGTTQRDGMGREEGSGWGTHV